MNKAIWLVLALGTASAVGCSASSDGTIAVSWAVTVDGAASTCASVGAASVEIVTRRSSGKEYTDLFNCTAGSGNVRVPEGTYTLFAYLLDANENRLTDGPGAPVIVEEDKTTQVGVIEFAFTFGSVSFRVHMGSSAVTGGNCSPTNPNLGAGVALEEIRVTSGTQCMAFSITGVTNDNNQPVTEATCDPFICQLETTVHTVSGLPDGQYVLQVLGYKGATSGTNAPLCYISNQMSFTITGSNHPNLQTIFAPFDDSQDTQGLCNATKPQG